MEKLLAVSDERLLLIYMVFCLVFLVGGGLSGLLLGLLHRRNPPNHRALGSLLSARSWSTPEMAFLLIAFLLLQVSLSFVLSFFGEEQLSLAQLAGTLLLYFIILAAMIQITRRHGESWASSYGMSVQQLKKVLFSPVLYLATMPFLMLATLGWHQLLEKGMGMEFELQEVVQFIAKEHSLLKVFYILTAIVVAPFFEELLFRGLLFPYLVKRAGLAGGTILVSLFFALIHFHLPSMVPLFLFSIVLCLAYWRMSSLWVCIGMHALFNAVSIVALSAVG